MKGKNKNTNKNNHNNSNNNNNQGGGSQGTYQGKNFDPNSHQNRNNQNNNSRNHNHNSNKNSNNNNNNNNHNSGKNNKNNSGNNNNNNNGKAYERNASGDRNWWADGRRENSQNRSFNEAGFDENGYDREFYNAAGFDINGYNRNGYNKDGKPKRAEERDPQGYNIAGFDANGFNRQGYNEEGFNREGYNWQGLDENGYDREGFDKDGFDQNGFDRQGFDVNGYNLENYNRDGMGLDGRYNGFADFTGPSRVTPVTWGTQPKQQVKRNPFRTEYQPTVSQLPAHPWAVQNPSSMGSWMNQFSAPSWTKPTQQLITSRTTPSQFGLNNAWRTIHPNQCCFCKDAHQAHACPFVVQKYWREANGRIELVTEFQRHHITQQPVRQERIFAGNEICAYCNRRHEESQCSEAISGGWTRDEYGNAIFVTTFSAEKMPRPSYTVKRCELCGGNHPQGQCFRNELLNPQNPEEWRNRERTLRNVFQPQRQTDLRPPPTDFACQTCGQVHSTTLCPGMAQQLPQQPLQGQCLVQAVQCAVCGQGHEAKSCPTLATLPRRSQPVQLLAAPSRFFRLACSSCGRGHETTQCPNIVKPSQIAQDGSGDVEMSYDVVMPTFSTEVGQPIQVSSPLVENRFQMSGGLQERNSPISEDGSIS